VAVCPAGPSRDQLRHTSEARLLHRDVLPWLLIFPETQWAGQGGAKGVGGGPLTSQTRPPTRFIAGSAQIWIHKN
jgi:hypothetical protein